MAKTVSSHVQSELPELGRGGARVADERHVAGCAEREAKARQLPRLLQRVAAAVLHLESDAGP